MIVETFQLSFCVFKSAFHLEIFSFLCGKSFLFLSYFCVLCIHTYTLYIAKYNLYKPHGKHRSIDFTKKKISYFYNLDRVKVMKNMQKVLVLLYI